MMTLMKLNLKLIKISLFLPAFWISYLIFFGDLGADPAKNLNHTFGTIAVLFLFTNLLIGNLLSIFKCRPQLLNDFFKNILQLLNQSRRWVGVVGFFYLFGHFIMYLFIESLEIKALKLIFEKTYLTIGFISFSILLLLTITSNNFMVRSLKKNWKKLHQFVYLVFFLTLIHISLIEKVDYTFYFFVTIPVLITYVLRILFRIKKSTLPQEQM